MRIPCIEVGNGETIPQVDHRVGAVLRGEPPTAASSSRRRRSRMHPPIPGVAVVAGAPPRARRSRPSSGRRAIPFEPFAAAGTSPVRGIRVADFTSFWAGPFFAHMLGMFGADVIHVESTVRPDGAWLMNHHPRAMAQWWERSPYFPATNTNKRGVTIDMSVAEGRGAGSPADRRQVTCSSRTPPRRDGVVRAVVGRSVRSTRIDHGADAGVRAHRVRERDRTGFAMTMEQVSGMAWLTGFPEHDPGRCSDRATRAPACTP